MQTGRGRTNRVLPEVGPHSHSALPELYECEPTFIFYHKIDSIDMSVRENWRPASNRP